MKLVFGYINVDNLDYQNEHSKLLTEYGCDKLVSEKIDGKLNRNAFDELKSKIREKDELVIVSIYVLPLTALQIIKFLNWCYNNDITVTPLREDYIDKRTVLLFSSIEKQTKRLRAKSNLGELPEGSKPGPKKGVLSQTAINQANSAALLYENKLKGINNMSVKEIMDKCGVKSKSTFYERIEYATGLTLEELKDKHLNKVR